MSVQSEITRINNNVANAYSAVGSKGGTLPAVQNSANLAAAINSISGTLISKTVTANGTYNASTDNADGYSTVIVAIPVYDGTVT